MSFYVYCAILCLFVGRHPVSSSRKEFSVIDDSMIGMSENIVNTRERRSSYGVKIASGAIVREGSILRGDVTIGGGTVVNSQARIIAESGPIVIGGGNIIEAMATIINRMSPGGSYDAGRPQIIANGNIFKSGSTCEALTVGGGNIFQSGAYVRRGAVVTNGNILGPS